MLTRIFKVGDFTSDDDVVTLFLDGDAVLIGKMNTRPSVGHQAVNVLAGSADQVRMKRITHFNG